MIKNIPNKYTRKMLLKELDRNFKEKYDFFYLPIDFSNNCNMGYAFINFLTFEDLKNFYIEFHDNKWSKFNSDKICEVKFAKIQGKAKCKKIFKDSILL